MPSDPLYSKPTWLHCSPTFWTAILAPPSRPQFANIVFVVHAGAHVLLLVLSPARCSSIPSTGCCLAGAPVSGLCTGISDFLLSLIFAAPPLVVQQMRRREWTSNSRRTRRVITHYFVLRKSSKQRVNSCPNPTSSALYSSSASNSISPVNFLPLILCQYSFAVGNCR